ncbi:MULTISPECIES: beta-propeller domain-containing protein [unclassified Crossiella]|uniref:beta-propeller domain-containing protein n=1 Tax=unclassified Crossiella TaxID=2620835 RepID=UPI001FFEB9D1|nr:MULTISPECIES: beta-propeller domain-containing protein [unclassified Crossiella]MCK2239657.1 beta-propeller domain-containing protein [Crossiella sp. S99.2]MCK2252352.1 beta-propeller domain-containing protein [Crossiella sp. S99.1]
MRAGVTAVVAGLVAGGAVSAAGPLAESGPPPVSDTAVRLVAYDSCPAALAGFRQAAAPVVSAYGFAQQGRPSTDARTGAELNSPGSMGDRSIESKAPDQGHSTTNRHEAGADEPDLVKSDGKRLVSIVDGKLRVIDLASNKATGVLELPGGPATQLLTHGDRALVLTSGVSHAEPRSYPKGDWPSGSAKLVLVDLSGTPKTVGSLDVDGSYVDSRQVGGVARVVIRSMPKLKFAYPDGTLNAEAALRRNQDIVRDSAIGDWLPRYRLDGEAGKAEGQLVDCARVNHPAKFSGASMLTVLTLPLDKPLGNGDPVTVAADGNTVYGNEKSLYVADDQWPRAVPLRGGAEVAPEPQPRTQVHQFSVDGSAPPKYLASGSVPGALLNQYSLSEHNGNLRIATTTNRGGAQPRQVPDSQSAVTVLARQGDKLTEIGKLDGLGKGERIYAVRFYGDTAYVVTFRQTDPLYTVDLRDPRRPRAVGELKITGYSAYLHMAGPGKLIGVGQEASDQGRVLGTQVSLFDVSDQSNPRRLAQHHLPGAFSEAEFDPHAFLYWQQTGLLVLPVSRGWAAPRGDRAMPPAGGALVLRIGDGNVTQLGQVAHPQDRSAGSDATVRRSLVAAGSLWTLSSAGIKRQDLTTLTDQSWLPFT